MSKMKVKSITKVMERNTTNLFDFVVEFEGKEYEFKEVKRFGLDLPEKQMKKLIETCEKPSDIFYIDDSKYNNLRRYQEYKERFPEII